METNATDERQRFVHDYASGQWSMSELCERYEVSRPTGYKWWRRFEAEGERGLAERSRAPEASPQRMSSEVEQRILVARRKYRWGAKKLLGVLREQDSRIVWPARSTINDLLRRHDLLAKRRRPRRKWQHPGAAPLATERPNQVWPIDFKGQFRLGNGRYCYPLTVTDHYSRSVLLCKALPSVKTVGARPALRRLFCEAGLPEAIRSDNGAPFVTGAIHGLSALSVWWMQLGIVHQRIRPSSPQENGTHERMHRELKREATRPPAYDLRGQQRKLNRFCALYNHERPHEALDGARPAQRWTPSPRPYPERIARPEYPGHLEVRLVSDIGTIRLKAAQVFLSRALSGQHVGLEEVDEGVWNILYYRTLLARVDERTHTVTGV